MGIVLGIQFFIKKTFFQSKKVFPENGRFWETPFINFIYYDLAKQTNVLMKQHLHCLFVCMKKFLQSKY